MVCSSVMEEKSRVKPVLGGLRDWKVSSSYWKWDGCTYLHIGLVVVEYRRSRGISEVAPRRKRRSNDLLTTPDRHCSGSKGRLRFRGTERLTRDQVLRTGNLKHKFYNRLSAINNPINQSRPYTYISTAQERPSWAKNKARPHLHPHIQQTHHHKLPIHYHQTPIPPPPQPVQSTTNPEKHGSKPQRSISKHNQHLKKQHHHSHPIRSLQAPTPPPHQHVPSTINREKPG